MSDLTTLAHAGVALAAALAILLVPRFSDENSRVRFAAWIALGVMGLAGFFNFGEIRHAHSDGFVHWWEQFHHRLGSTYFPELGYDGLYAASVAAQWESHPERAVGGVMRDLRNNRLTHTQDLRDHVREVRARFAPERWKRFRADHAVFIDATSEAFMTEIRRDHGYNASPAWTFVARQTGGWSRVSKRSARALGVLDLVLLAMLLGALFRTFGIEVEASAAAILGLAYGWRYNYLGAFLRVDWLVALGLGLCALRRERFVVAGACFGYAIAGRVFPLLFLAASLLVALAAGGLAGRGAGAWSEFFRNTRLYAESHSENRVGLGRLFTAEVRPREEAPTIESAGARPGSAATEALPRPGRPHGWQSIAKLVVQAFAIFLFALSVRRGGLAGAAAIGSAIVFALTPAGSYYSVMLMLLPAWGAPNATGADREPRTQVDGSHRAHARFAGRLAASATLALGSALYLHRLALPTAVEARFDWMTWGLILVFAAALLPRAIRSARPAQTVQTVQTVQTNGSD